DAQGGGGLDAGESLGELGHETQRNLSGAASAGRAGIRQTPRPRHAANASRQRGGRRRTAPGGGYSASRARLRRFLPSRLFEISTPRRRTRAGDRARGGLSRRRARKRLSES